MPSPALRFATTVHHHHHLGFNHALSSSAAQNLFTSVSFPSSNFRNYPRNLAAQCQKKPVPDNNGRAAKGRGLLNVRGKTDNVWSVDNELSAKERDRGRSQRRRGKRRVVRRKKSAGGKDALVSGAMLMEVETVLQTQEPVIRPVWNTFSSSVSGIWKGVGAVFSPITAEMEPIDIGTRGEHLYDCYTVSHIEAVPSSSGGAASQIRRKINWVTLNPYGEIPQLKNGHGALPKNDIDRSGNKRVLPQFESFDFGRSDVMEEDVMGNEPGLVFFEDGSYSRGPIDIPVGEDDDDSKYYLSPTFKFEQCLVKGCHKRLRIVHTIEFSNGGSNIQIMRVSVYEEQWDSPANLPDQSKVEFELKPFSQRKRTKPTELAGSWKVFEVSATPVFGEEIDQTLMEQNNSTPYVYLCTETLKNRSLPENPVYFGEEEMLDMQDVTMLWLPGGVTAYVDINKDGILCIGVGWYSDEGINLVMERDYGVDGKLKEVRSKSEVKRKWSDPVPV